MFSKEDLIEALRLRYDYYSASSMFDLARDRAELADKDSYDAAELRAFRAAVQAVGDRVGTVLAQLDRWLDRWLEDAPEAAREGVGKADAKPEPRSAAKPEPKIDAKSEPASGAKSEPAREPEAEAKPASRPDAEREPRSATSSDAKPGAKAASQLETTIVLTGVPAGEGEQVLVCGGGKDLGDWDPAHARPMSREGDEWLTTLAVAPDAEVPFKFLKRTADGEVIWEDGDNRHLVAKPRVDATWRAAQ